MNVSASRAIGMYLLQMLGIFVGRTYDMLTGLGLMALLLVLQEPERLFDVSFLMSFGAVLGICVLTPVISGDGSEKDTDAESEAAGMSEWLRIVADILGDSAYERNKHREGWRKMTYEGIQHMLSAVKSGFAASAGVILFTLPIQLWFFYEIPVYSVLLNLLVLPFMSVVMAGGILSLIPGLGVVGTVDCLILWWYEWICGRFEELPGAIWCVGRPAIWQMVCYYVGIFLLVFVRKYAEESIRNRALRLIAVMIILGLSIGLLTGNFDRGSRVTFLDVGQGDSIVVETGQGAYLFDCGSTSRKNIGEYVLKPYLKSRGSCTLRGVFVSHPDEDHMNGVIELLENRADWGIVVEQLFLPAIAEEKRTEAFATLLAAAEAAEVPVSYIKCGDEIRDSRFRLLCLHPEENTTLADANAYSECFYVEVFAKKVKWEAIDAREAKGDMEANDARGGSAAGKISILLTGDVEGEGERQLTQELQTQQEFKVDILKVAHHGSGYSTGTEFLDAASPTAAIISCGRNNSYGHPHAETLQRLEDARVPWYGTMDYGALTVTVDSHGNRLRGYLSGE